MKGITLYVDPFGNGPKEMHNQHLIKETKKKHGGDEN